MFRLPMEGTVQHVRHVPIGCRCSLVAKVNWKTFGVVISMVARAKSYSFHMVDDEFFNFKG